MERNIAFYWGNIPYPLFGGIDRVTIVLAEEFAKRGMHIYCIYSGGRENPLPKCFSGIFKYERPKEQYTTLERYLLENHIEIVINQRFQDFSLIKNLHSATYPHGIKLYTVIHSSPGFEFITAHKGIKQVGRRLYNLVLRRRYIRHHNELVTYSKHVILLSHSFVPQYKQIYRIPSVQYPKITAIPNPCTLKKGGGGGGESIYLLISKK